jgi:hypothetical protein
MYFQSRKRSREEGENSINTQKIRCNKKDYGGARTPSRIRKYILENDQKQSIRDSGISVDSTNLCHISLESVTKVHFKVIMKSDFTIDATGHLRIL